MVGKTAGHAREVMHTAWVLRIKTRRRLAHSLAQALDSKQTLGVAAIIIITPQD